MAPVIKTNKWRIFDYAESQDRLFMEGVDEFWLHTGEHVAIPYAGVLEFRGLLVHEWREYFDGRISSSMKAGAPMTDEIQSMISRPVAK
jgi:limonene-1,2-epoxide hydrolase